MKGKIKMTEMQLWTLLMEQKIDVNTYNDWIVRIKAKERMRTNLIQRAILK